MSINIARRLMDKIELQKRYILARIDYYQRIGVNDEIIDNTINGLAIEKSELFISQYKDSLADLSTRSALLNLLEQYGARKNGNSYTDRVYNAIANFTPNQAKENDSSDNLEK